MSLLVRSIISRAFITAIITALIGGLTGCGFHLRGSVILPEVMTTTFIQDDFPRSLIFPKLKYTLTKNNINVIDSINGSANNTTANGTKNNSVAVLKIINESFKRRLLSSGSSTLIKEYQLDYAVTFSLSNYDNKVKNDALYDANNMFTKKTEEEPRNSTLLPNQTINIIREQTFDETKVLSKTTEQEKLQQEMIGDAVRQILRRLQSLNQPLIGSGK